MYVLNGMGSVERQPAVVRAASRRANRSAAAAPNALNLSCVAVRKMSDLPHPWSGNLLPNGPICTVQKSRFRGPLSVTMIRSCRESKAVLSMHFCLAIARKPFFAAG